MSLGNRRNVVVTVGETETGKTTLMDELIKDYPTGRGMVTICDTQHENLLRKYGQITIDTIPKQTKGKYRYTGQDWKGFIDRCAENYRPQSPKKGLIYFDDADILPQSEYKPLTDLMGGLRHKHLDIMFTFHQLWRVPPYIMDNANIVILFKTGESMDKGNISRFKHGARIMQAHTEVEANINQYFHKVVKIHGPTR